MSSELETKLDRVYENALQSWSEMAREAGFSDFWQTNNGLQVEFSGVFNWAYRVKVRPSGKLLGKETLEVHGIWEANQSFPIVSSLAASELIDAGLGFPLLWLAREIEGYGWDYDLVGCTDNKWAKPIEEKVGDWPDYRKLDLDESFWQERPLPIDHGDKVSQSILGFEGEESALASVRYWNNMFLDGASGPADADLNSIQLLDAPILKLNGLIVPNTQATPLLHRAAEILSEEFC